MQQPIFVDLPVREPTTIVFPKVFDMTGPTVEEEKKSKIDWIDESAEEEDSLSD